MGRRILGRTAAVLLVVMVWLGGMASAEINVNIDLSGPKEEIIESRTDIHTSNIADLRSANEDMQKWLIPWAKIKNNPQLYRCEIQGQAWHDGKTFKATKTNYPNTNHMSWIFYVYQRRYQTDKDGTTKEVAANSLYKGRFDLLFSAVPASKGLKYTTFTPLNEAEGVILNSLYAAESIYGDSWEKFLSEWREKSTKDKSHEYKEKEFTTASGQKVYLLESWQYSGNSFHSLGGRALVLVEIPSLPEKYVIHYEVYPGGGFGEKGKQGHASQIAKLETYLANLTITASDPVVYEVNLTNLQAADSGDKESVVVTTKANSKPGEDGGVAIPIAIVIASAAAAAALGAAGSSGKDEGGRQSAFRLYVYKDFGSRIKKGAPPVYVYARIAETRPDGMEVDRPDLTAQIRIFSETEGVEATEHGLVNSGAVNYMAAAVYIPSDSLPDVECAVAFCFEGEGGTFTERLIFVLVGEPYIEYPAQDHLDAVMLVNALFGGNDIYEVPFNLCDFAQDLEAGNITVESGSGDLQVSVEKLDVFKFKAVIVNHTPPIEPDALIASKLTVYMKITAQGEKERAESTFIVDLYPEGISVSNAVIEDGCLIVDTCPSDDQGFFAQEIRPTRFDLACAYKDAAGNVIVERRLAVAECLDGENEAARNMLLRLPYQVNVEMGNDGIYMIEPQKTLPAVGVEYLAKWYVESLGAVHYDKRLPIKFKGEVPDPRGTKEWQAEHDLLIRACQRYGLQKNSQAQKLVREVRGSSVVAASTLKQIRYAICYEATIYYATDASELKAVGDHMNNWVAGLEMTKWLGDQAFTYVVKYYVFVHFRDYEMAELTEIVLTPFKDMLTEYAGEYWAAQSWGYEYQFDVTKITQAAHKVLEGLMLAVIHSDAPLAPKKVVAVGLAFAFTNFARHYMYDEECKGDFSKCCLAVLKDCTVELLKTVIGNWLKEKIGSDAMDNVLQSGSAKQMKDFITEKTKWALFHNKTVNAVAGAGYTISAAQLDYLSDMAVNMSADLLANLTWNTLGAEVTTTVVNGEEIYCVNFTNPVGETVFQIPLNKALELILDWFVPDEVKRLLNKLNKVEMPDHVPHSKEGEGEQLLQGRI